MTEHLLVYAVLVVAPAGAFYGFRRAVEWFCGPRRRTASTPAPPDLDRLTDRLRRLDREFREVQHATGLPARASRLRSVHLAYDDTLCACAAALDLPAPGHPPLPAVVRLETEAALASRGVVW